MNSPDPELRERRERVFIVLAGVFLGSMTMLNILGITRFIHIGALQLAVGVLPYPLTFLCTDFISELYGRRRANFVVWVGLLLNLMVIGFLYLGDAFPRIDYQADFQRLRVIHFEPVRDPNTGQPLRRPGSGEVLERIVVPKGGITVPVTEVALAPLTTADGSAIQDPLTGAPLGTLVDATSGAPLVQEEELFGRIVFATRQAVFGSMLAYLAAQFCDVFLFHFWKRLTRGRHLWLRNNGSTLVSQAVDATAVVSLAFGAQVLAGTMTAGVLGGLIWDNYRFKLIIALLDTIPFYIGVRWLTRYLQIDPAADVE